MAFELRPAGRLLLVVAGLFLAWLGADRAGWTPDSWPHPFPPPAATERAEGREGPRAVPAAREGTAPAGFVYGDAPACEARVRVAVPRYRWRGAGAPAAAPAGQAPSPTGPESGAGARASAGEAEAGPAGEQAQVGPAGVQVRVEPETVAGPAPARGPGPNQVAGAAPGPAVVQVASAREALARLAAGEADAALVSVSELVAAWDVASARAAPRIAGMAPGAELAFAISLRIAGEADLETARIAAVPGSAEEYLALGILARAGTERYWLVPARDADDAVAKLERGEVDAAAVPLPALAPVVQEGRARLLAGPRPLDPAVWVTAGAGCRPELSDGGAGVLDLPAAWAAARRVRGGPAPAEVLGVLDRPVLRELLGPEPAGAGEGR